VLVSLCVLASACIKVPDFVPRDAPGGDGSDAMSDGGILPVVSVVMNDDAADVTGPGYTLRFSTDGALFPFQLNPAGQLLMGGGQMCSDESAMGLAIYPLLRVNGADQAGMGTPSLTILASGPYVGSVQVLWSGTLPCSDGSSSAIFGRSRFSFFPDGRISRFDTLHNSGTHAAADCTACVGGMATEFVVTTYTTLIVDGNAFMTDGNLVNAGHGAEAMPGASTCMSERGQSIAFAWTDAATRLRVAAAPPPARTIAFVKDWHRGATLPITTWEATTHMGISTQACGVLESRIVPHSEADHQLVIAGVPMSAALIDGIYGTAEDDTDGYPVTFPVTLSAAATPLPNIPPGFAVWLYHDPLPATLTLTHSGNPTGTWYREQRVSPSSVILWFDVGLGQGETITVSGS
jgi:hypothetical protein